MSDEWIQHQVSDERMVRARPWQGGYATDTNDTNGKVYVADFEVLHLELELGELRWRTELAGTVRFDGCMNWGASDGTLAHLCGPGAVDEIAECLRAAFALGHRVLGEQAMFEAPEIGVTGGGVPIVTTRSTDDD